MTIEREIYATEEQIRRVIAHAEALAEEARILAENANEHAGKSSARLIAVIERDKAVKGY